MSAPAFTAWLDDFFDAYFMRRAVNATFIGVHDYDDQLPDVSALAGDAKALLARLQALPEESLSPVEALDRQLAEGFLLVQRWESASPHFGWSNPSLFTGEAIFGVVGLLLQHRSAEARLALIPDFLDDVAHELRPAPRAWIARARRECTGAQLLLRGLDAQPAMAAFDRFDQRLQRLEATEDYACGAEAFALLLRYGHFLDMSAEDLEQLALARLAELGDGPPAVASEPSQGEYLERCQSVWRAAVDLAEQHDLLSVPDWPVRYVEKPEWAREAAPYLYFLPYRSPPPMDMPPIVEYYVPAGADEATIKLNHVVHHGSLGHHVQNWHAARAASRIGRIAAVDCASRIAMLCGGTMAEGWACYVTDLVDEAGFLTPAEQYAQHQTRLRIAARAVVDVRLHHGRWSLADAAAFYEQRVGMPAAAAHAEAVKNSLFPSTASMYLAGWQAIRNARREFLRKPVSLREFHERFLSFGSIPVSLVAKALLREEICL